MPWHGDKRCGNGGINAERVILMTVLLILIVVMITYATVESNQNKGLKWEIGSFCYLHPQSMSPLEISSRFSILVTTTAVKIKSSRTLFHPYTCPLTHAHSFTHTHVLSLTHTLSPKHTPSDARTLIHTHPLALTHSSIHTHILMFIHDTYPYVHT